MPSGPFIEAMPTKLFSLISEAATGETSMTPQLSARLTLTLAPSRVAMVAVLPSMAEIVPRIRVGGVWARVAVAAPTASKRAVKPARKRMGVMVVFSLQDHQSSHGRLAGTAYVCVNSPERTAPGR